MVFVPPPSLITDDETDDSRRYPSRITPTSEAQYAAAVSVSQVDLPTVARMCRRGVPDKVRPTFWKLLLGFFPPATERWEELRQTKTEEYRELLHIVCRLDENNNVIIHEASNRDVDVDIPRTMAAMHFFNMFQEFTLPEGSHTTFSPTQQSLRRIIHTLAGVNKGFGYVQGMNELVGHLLYAYTCGDTSAVDDSAEAEVFFCFQAMLSDLGDDFCRSLDFDQDTGVMSTLRNFEAVLLFIDPELGRHLEVHEVKSQFFAFRWLTLLFTQEFTVPDVFRIWDFLFSFRGNLRGTVLYIAVSMLSYQRDEILRMDSLSTILPFLQSYPPCDVSNFLELAGDWISRYGFRPVSKLKGATPEKVAELQREFRVSFPGSAPKRGALTDWMNSVWNSAKTKYTGGSVR
ncbi:putative GTPase activator-like protein [Trypanosoma vivax]|nr:putative GTPase activator-like protein [Trypanosoma vivax]